MSDVVVLSVARDESSAREFVHKLTAHHSQTESDANSDAIPFELRTKYYSVTLRLRCHDDELTSAITTTPLFGFANLDALRSELDALIVLIHAGRHGNDVAALTSFLTERVLTHHRPSIVALVDLSLNLDQLTRLSQNDTFRDWLADEQIEYITMCAVEDDPDANDVFGYDRVHQVLSAHMWRDLVRVEKPRTTTVPVEAEEPDEVDINDDDDDEDDEEDQAPVASAETNDERELRKFEEALKAMAVHQEKSVQQRKPTSAPAASDDAPIAVEEVGANETFEQRKARLANAERMMAMFLEGVGLTMDDI